MTLMFDLGVLLQVKIGCYINSYVSNGEIIPWSSLYFVLYIQHDPVQLPFSESLICGVNFCFFNGFFLNFLISGLGFASD